VATTYVDPTSLTATIPEDLMGAGGTSLAIAVWVMEADGSHSGTVVFTVEFPATELQTWTTVEAVCGEIPGFQRGGRIKDEQILVWMRSIAQSIAGVMLRRGLSTDPATWEAPGTAGAPAASGVLELINRLGAAARLAAAVASEFGTGEWGVAKNLERAHEREFKGLEGGQYDKLFRPGAATVESGPGLCGGETDLEDGSSSARFTKGQVF
jgi:hypothetical protein